MITWTYDSSSVSPEGFIYSVSSFSTELSDGSATTPTMTITARQNFGWEVGKVVTADGWPFKITGKSVRNSICTLTLQGINGGTGNSYTGISLSNTSISDSATSAATTIYGTLPDGYPSGKWCRPLSGNKGEWTPSSTGTIADSWTITFEGEDDSSNYGGGPSYLLFGLTTPSSTLGISGTLVSKVQISWRASASVPQWAGVTAYEASTDSSTGDFTSMSAPYTATSTGGTIAGGDVWSDLDAHSLTMADIDYISDFTIDGGTAYGKLKGSAPEETGARFKQQTASPQTSTWRGVAGVCTCAPKRQTYTIEDSEAWLAAHQKTVACSSSGIKCVLVKPDFTAVAVRTLGMGNVVSVTETDQDYQYKGVTLKPDDDVTIGTGEKEVSINILGNAISAHPYFFQYNEGPSGPVPLETGETGYVSARGLAKGITQAFLADFNEGTAANQNGTQTLRFDFEKAVAADTYLHVKDGATLSKYEKMAIAVTSNQSTIANFFTRDAYYIQDIDVSALSAGDSYPVWSVVVPYDVGKNLYLGELVLLDLISQWSTKQKGFITSLTIDWTNNQVTALMALSATTDDASAVTYKPELVSFLPLTKKVVTSGTGVLFDGTTVYRGCYELAAGGTAIGITVATLDTTKAFAVQVGDTVYSSTAYFSGSPRTILTADNGFTNSTYTTTTTRANNCTAGGVYMVQTSSTKAYVFVPDSLVGQVKAVWYNATVEET